LCYSKRIKNEKQAKKRKFSNFINFTMYNTDLIKLNERITKTLDFTIEWHVSACSYFLCFIKAQSNKYWGIA
jgi:hypothetical protein